MWNVVRSAFVATRRAWARSQAGRAKTQRYWPALSFDYRVGISVDGTASTTKSLREQCVRLTVYGEVDTPIGKIGGSWTKSCSGASTSDTH
jgi:hypothetical protein